jgi:hypothetical protein
MTAPVDHLAPVRPGRLPLAVVGDVPLEFRELLGRHQRKFEQIS